MTRAPAFCLGLLTLFVVGLTPALVEAQSQRWSVFRNCNTRPCTIGVAVSTWSEPGWSRISTHSYPNAAWKRACQLHYNNRGYNSPDIANGTVNCSVYQ